MRGLALACLLLGTLAAVGCCNVPCDPCCPPCTEVKGRDSLFKNPPPRAAALPGEVPAAGNVPPAPAEAPETLEST